jgi:DNA gyrase subunit A
MTDSKQRIAKEVFETPVDIEVRDSFLSYALSVITSRAIPDARDGLKPVQRRILYSMHAQGIRPGTPYKKCARVVGDTMGRYHPHGDSSIYEALVRLAQDFAMRVPLVDGHGNFGTLSDPPAASRYTECRMTDAAIEMVGEISEDTVDMQPNYDGTEIEPAVLPARLPNLLLNGTSGIAVGMATNIPTHNLGEVVAAAIHLLEHPDATLDDLLEFVPAPDFPTGGVLIDTGGVRDAFETGRGAFKLRAKAEVADVSARRRGIVITELPYNVGAERFIARCKQLIGAKQLDGIADIKDLSDRKRGTRIVVECRTGVNPHAVLNELYVKTPLEEGFSVNAVALVDGRPETLGLVRMLQLYIEHRLEVVVRRTKYRLRKAEERSHVVSALVSALAKIDEVVAIIRKAKDTDDARKKLMRLLSIDDGQAGHILEMPLRRLTSLEVRKLKEELAVLAATIKDLEDVVARPERQRSLVASELREASHEHATPRRTKIVRVDPNAVTAPSPLATSFELPDEVCVVRLSATGMIGTAPVDSRSRKPGRHDMVVSDVVTTSRSTVKVVTSDGMMHLVGVVELPAVDAKNPGVAVSELVDVPHGGRAVAVIGDGVDVVVVTARGTVKRVAADQLAVRKAAELITFKDADEVVAVLAVSGSEELVMVTSDAQLLRMALGSVRAQGRKGGGVAGMRVAEGCRVLAAGLVGDGVNVVTLTDRATVKMTPVSEYPAKGRATGGVRCMRLRAGESQLVAAVVTDRPVVAGEGRTVRVLTLAAGRRDGTGEPVEGGASILGQS